MKKVYSISAIVLTGVTLVAYLFGKIDSVTFGTVTGMIATTLFGLYQKFEKGVILEEKLKLEDQLQYERQFVKGAESAHNQMANDLTNAKKVISNLTERLKETAKVVEEITTEVVVKKTKNRKNK